MLTDHFITEIDGQNVVGMNDDKILKVIKSKDRTVTVTVMPEFVYDHMVRENTFLVLREAFYSINYCRRVPVLQLTVFHQLDGLPEGRHVSNSEYGHPVKYLI